MIGDITIGQYFTGNSVLHKIDPRTKIILTIVYIIILFIVNNPFAYLINGIFILSLYIICKIPFKMIFSNMKPILPVLFFTFLINLFFVKTGDIIFRFWIFSITTGAINLALIMIVRIVLLIAGSSLLTYTTLPIDLTDGIEILLSPLKKIHFPVHELAMMMTIAMRFVPTLIDETTKIMAAQKSRGVDMENGSIIKRVKSIIPILIPLFVSAFRRANELSIAMESRCYRGGDGRTRYRALKYSYLDFLSIIFMILFFTVLICLNIFT